MYGVRIVNKYSLLVWPFFHFGVALTSLWGGFRNKQALKNPSSLLYSLPRCDEVAATKCALKLLKLRNSYTKMK